MATNFGPEISQVAPLQTNATPQAGVESSPVLLGGVSKLFQQAEELLESNKKSKAQAFVADFTNKQLKIADAVDQTGMTSAFARTLMRKNLMEAIDQNPSLAKELISAQTSIVALPGAADIIKAGTDDEQERRADRDRLVSAGLLTPGASDDEYEQVAANARSLVSAQATHKARMDALELEKATLAVGSARRNAIEEEQKSITLDFMKSAAPMEYQRVKSGFEAILSDGSLTEAERVAAIDDYYNQWQTEMASQFGSLTEHEGSAFAKPVELYYKTYLARAKGEITDEAVKRQTDRILASEKLTAISDPVVARAVAASNLVNSDVFTNIMMQANSPVQQSFLNFIKGASPEQGKTPQNPFPSQDSDKFGLRNYLQGVSEIGRSKDEGAKEEASHRLEVALDNIVMHEGILRSDPTAGGEVVAWMATPEFNNLLNENPDLREKAQEAGEVIQRYYSDELMGTIKREFKESKVRVEPPEGATVSGAPEMYAYGDTEDEIQAVATKDGMEFTAIDPDNKFAVDKARDLNRKVRPLIMRAVKAGAHLEGRTDYAELWKEVSMALLDQTPEDNTFTPEDFTLPAEPLLRVANSPELTKLMDKHEGGGRYDTLLGHSQRSGPFVGVDVSKMTIGEAINFSSVDGPYAQYSKRKVGRVATPMGRYQIVGRTLRRVARAMKLPPNTPFNEQTQDAMFSFLVREALSGKKNVVAKRSAMKGVWEGFKYVPDAVLDKAIEEFENGL